MKVLCIGNSCIETTCPIDKQIVEEEEIKVAEKYECGGGNAGNIAYLLGKWGVESYIASMLGADDFANKIKKEYETIGVKIDFIETSYDKGTNQKVILVNKNNKCKTVLDLTNNSYLKKYAFNVEPDLIISDGSDYNASLAAFDRYSKAVSFLSITSPVNESIEMGKYVNYIILNRKTAEAITNSKVDYNESSTIVNIYNKLKQKYSKAEIIITLGERGCVYSINGQVKIMPTVRVDVVDTNGAGSVFVGAFAYATGRNFGLEKAIAYAIIASALSTTKMTSRLAIPSLIEVSNYYDSKFGSSNNPNKQSEQNNNVNMTTEQSNQTNNDLNSASNINTNNEINNVNQ